MKIFGNSRLLELSPIDEERTPTVEECLRFALSSEDSAMILTGVKSPEEMEPNVGIANNYQPLTDAEQQYLRVC